jgi:hypothetical protein
MHYLKSFLIAGCIAALTWGLSGCKDDENAPSLQSITVTPAAVSLVAGATQPLTVTLVPEGVTGVTVSFQSASAAIATVTSSGLVTAVAAGSTTITVSAPGVKEVKVPVTVTAVFTPALEVTPAVPEQVLAAGGSLEFAVAANAEWTYTLSAGADAWLTEAAPKTATALTLTVAANAATEERTATITFALAGEHSAVTQAVNVSQAAFAPALEVTPAEPAQASAAGGPLEFAITANADWTYTLSEGADAWLTNPDKTANALTLTVAPNATEETKTATISFYLEGYRDVTQVIEVSQATQMNEEDFGLGAVIAGVLTVTSSADLKTAAEALTAGNYIANITETMTLNEADDNGTYITLETPGVTISLRGAGYTVSPTNDATIVKINGGKLILRDITLSKAGANMPTVNVGAGGELVIHDGVSITNASPESPTNAGVDVSGKFVMKGGKIYGHRRAGGGAGLYIHGEGEFRMDGGEIYDNTAQYAGGMFIMGANASFIMNGGELYDNHSTDKAEGGGAVYIWQNGHVEIHTGAIIYGKDGDGNNKAGNTSVVSGDTYGHAVTAFYNISSGKYRSTTIQGEELSITLSGGAETGSTVGTWVSF